MLETLINCTNGFLTSTDIHQNKDIRNSLNVVLK